MSYFWMSQRQVCTNFSLFLWVVIYRYAIGLDSVSAARVADVLHAIAHDPIKPTPIIASIHQPRFVSVSLGAGCRLQPLEQFTTISEI